MKSKHISLLAIGIFSLLLVSVSAQAVHVPSHVPGQNPQEPTAAQIAKFCQGYAKLKPTAQSEKKKQYDKYCKKSQLKPIVKKPVITRLVIKEKCADIKDEIRILGRDFGKQGSVQLRLNGVELPTKIRRWTPTELRIVLDRKTKPGKRYQLSVKTAAGSSNEKPLLLCKEKPPLPLPVTSKQAPSPKQPQIKPIVKTPLVVIPSQNGVSLMPLGKTDLLVNITAPNKVTAGKSIPGLRVEAKNIGKIQASGYKIDLILSKDKRITKRPELMKQSGTSLLQTISLTTPLAPKGRKDYFPAILLPANTAAGKYYLCAIIDPANKLKEYKENNNTQCTKLQVAAAKKVTPVVGQLGSKLREKVQIQPKQIPGLKPAKLEKPVTPQNIQAAMLYTNSLTINGAPFGPFGLIDVEEGATARVNWTFPRESGVQLVRLRIKSGRIGAGESTCPEPGTPGLAGGALMDGWDSGGLALPGRAQWYPNPSAATPDSGSGSIVLSPGGIYDLNQYTPGQEYSFVACGLSPAADGGFEFVHESNVVMMWYAGSSTAWWSGDFLLDQFFPMADLVVGEMQLIQQGRDRGKFLIFARDNGSTRGSVENPFQYEVFVDGRSVERGNVVRFLNGWAAITDYRLPTVGAWHTVRVVINGNRVYSESNYNNNSMIQQLALGTPGISPQNQIIDAQVIREAPDWAMIRVRYTFTGGESVSSRTGRSSSSIQMRVRIELGSRDSHDPLCASVGSDAVQPFIPSGINRQITFRCILDRVGTVEKDNILVDLSRTGVGVVIDKRFPYLKTWSRSSTQQPDLVPEILSITERELEPRTTVKIRVRNQGTSAATSSTMNLSSRTPASMASQNPACINASGRIPDFNTASVPSLMPGEVVTLNVTLPCTYLHTRTRGEYLVRAWVDRARSIQESNEDNNTHILDAASLPHRQLRSSGGLTGESGF